jgi:PAS domain S-box-containing protein
MPVAREELINIRTHCNDFRKEETAIQSLDINGTVIDVSPTWLKLTGYERDEVIGRHFWEFLGAKSLLQAKDSFPQLRDFGYINNVALKIKRKDKSLVDINLNATSRYKHDGNLERTFYETTLSQTITKSLSLGVLTSITGAKARLRHTHTVIASS